MKNIVGVALLLGGVALLALGPRVFGPWWTVGGFAAFVFGFVLVMNAAKSRRLAKAMRTDVAGGGDVGSSYYGDIGDGGGSGDSGGGDGH